MEGNTLMDLYPKGTGELVPLRLTKDGAAATATSVTDVNVDVYAASSPAPGTYSVPCVFSNGYWSFQIPPSLVPGLYAVRAKIDAPGEAGVLLDCGEITIIP
jgi:hypothetical protein